MTTDLTPEHDAFCQRYLSNLCSDAIIHERVQRLHRQADLLTLTELLNQRGHHLSPLEYNGLLTLTIRLRREYLRLPYWQADGADQLIAKIDQVLHRSTIKPMGQQRGES